MHAQEWHADKPEDEKADQRVGLDSLGLRDAIVEREKRGPYCADHHPNAIRTVHILDGKPKDGQDRATYNGDVGAPETP